MKIKPKYNQKAVIPALPATQGGLIIHNYYDCELYIPVSSIRHLQKHGKKTEKRWSDMQTQIIMHETGSFVYEHPIRSDFDTLMKIMKLSQLGYDIDLRRHSGKKAVPIADISVLLKDLPDNLQDEIKTRIFTPALRTPC